MNETLRIAFEECLAAFEQGASLEDCLQLHPELADQLRPQLETILRTRALAESIHPRPGFQASSRAQFLAQANRPIRQNQPERSRWNAPRPWSERLAWLFTPLARKVASVVIILMVLVLAGNGVLNASAQSLPGSPLFGLKRTLEDARLAFTPAGEDRARLEDSIRETRHQEAVQVTESRMNVALEFGGLLEAMNGEVWQVGGLTVIVRPGTPIQGAPLPGLYLYIHGQTQADQSILAEEIVVQGLIFQGVVTHLEAGIWQIGDRTIFTSAETKIKGGPRPGDQVEVNAILLSDGGLLAEQIERVGRDSESTPGADDSPDHSGSPTQVPFLQPTDDKGGSGKDSSPPSSGSTGGSSTSGGSGGSGSNGSSGGSDGGSQPGKTPEPTRTPAAQAATQTPNSGGSGSGGGSSPSQTPQPTHIPGGATAAPTRTPVPQEVGFQGVVEKMGGSAWVVAGQRVQVNGSTAIDSGIKPGDMVEVRGLAQTDGSLMATRIQKK